MATEHEPALIAQALADLVVWSRELGFQQCAVARLAASDVEAVLEALAEFDSSRHHAALDALFQAPEP